VRLAFLLVPLAAIGGLALRPSEPTVAAPVQAPDARTTYLADCGVCHGATGEGTRRGPRVAGIGQALVDYEVSTGRMPIRDPDDKVVRRSVRYTPQQVRDLVAYVVGFAPGGVAIPQLDLAAANLAAGGEQYRLQCAACHAWAADGGALEHREAPALHRATATQIAEAVRTGPGTMPAFGPAALDNQQLADVVRYVRYLKHPKDRGGLGLWHLGPVAEGAVAWVIGLFLLILATLWIGEREPH
jgi:ubiquinol-cytochrome c reductase cytochrome c subunit